MEGISASWKGDYIDGISISYGYACAKDFSDFDSVLKAADEKMYAFKENYYRSTGKSRRTQ